MLFLHSSRARICPNAIFFFFFFFISLFVFRLSSSEFWHFEQMPNIKFRMSKCYFCIPAEPEYVQMLFFFFFFSLFVFRHSGWGRLSIRADAESDYKFWMSKCYVSVITFIITHDDNCVMSFWWRGRFLPETNACWWASCNCSRQKIILEQIVLVFSHTWDKNIPFYGSLSRSACFILG